MLHSVFVLLLACVGYTVQQHGAHPPGVPPPNQGHHGDHADIRQPDGFGVNPHDAEHIKEHLKEVVEKPKEEMTDEELEFHYFKLHDYDGNNKLDGTEITKAITHFHEGELRAALHTSDGGSDKSPMGEENQDQKHIDRKVFSDEEIANIVDMVLKEDDLNGDGYIEYVEFVTAQRKARGEGK